MTYWLEQLPATWRKYPAWAVFAERRDKARPEDQHLTPSQQYGVVPQSEYMELTGNRVVLNLAGADNMKAVRKGDFIIHLRSFQGGIEASDVYGKVSTAYTVLQPAHRLEHDYYRYLLKADLFIEQLVNLTDQLRDGQSINFARFSRLRLPVPPLEEQRRIADFLDRETAEIDAMDAELNHLIDTLNERRALVVESVLSNSGEEAKLGYLVESLAGYAFPAREFSRDERDIRLLRGVNVKPQSTNWSEAVYWPADRLEGLERYELQVGDVVLGMDRPFVGGGTRVLRIGPTDLPALLLQRVLRLRALMGGSSDFIMLALMTRAFEEYATPEATGISVPHISEGQVLDFRLRVPAPTEQHEIAESILNQVVRIDEMITDANRLKALLAERRSTLITEVATGRKEVPA